MVSRFNCIVPKAARNHCSCLIELTSWRQNLTCEKEEDEDHNQSVSKVEDGAGSSDDLQLWEEVMDSIDKQIHCCEATGQEGTPPPVVVLAKDDMLGTKYEIWSLQHIQN